MGLSFSNIHVRMERSLDEALAGRIAEILMRGADAEPVADASEADVMVRVCAGKDSPWVTVLADSIDDDLEEQLLKTRALSEALEARTLAIACSDSDYLCLNLVDAKTKTDIWAAHGKFPFGKAPRRSNPAAWKAYVKDNAHFAQTLRASSVFAEDALPDLAAELGLPAGQARCMEGEIPEDARFFQFGYKMKEAEGETPPRFGMLYEELYYGVGRTKCIPFLNKGAASKGVAVALTGECIREHQIKVEKIELQFHLSRGEWAHIPLHLEETTYDDGSCWLMAECPEFCIPPAVKDSLPWKKKQDLEFQRAVIVRLLLAPDRETEEYGTLQVTLIPMKNYDGQCGCVMKYYTNDNSPFRDAGRR